MGSVKKTRVHTYDLKKWSELIPVWKNGRSYFYCPNCGVEHIHPVLKPKKRIKCPCCDTPVKYDQGFFRLITCKGASMDIDERYDYIKDADTFITITNKTAMNKDISKSEIHFKEMQEMRVMAYTTTKTEGFLHSIGSQNKKYMEDFDTDKIKSDKEMLIDYIKKMISVENVVFTLTRRLETLYNEKIEVESELKATYSQQIINLKEEFKNPKTATKKRTIPAFNKPQPVKPTPPKEPIYQIAGLFNKKKIETENLQIKEKYEKKCKLYERQLNKYENDLKAWYEEKEAHNLMRQELLNEQSQLMNKEADECKNIISSQINDLLIVFKTDILEAYDEVTANTLKFNFYTDEINEVEDLLRKAIECRANLYDYDIVFMKYRNVVALSAFYEYLMSNRCDSLEGASGAYNLYENELRANLIIEKLSDIIQSLEQIQQNQFVLYSELKKINKNLDALNYSMRSAAASLSQISESNRQINENTKNIAENTKVIAYNTEKTAYYAKLNAELTDSVGLMVALS